jgi:hypothetical protein
VEAQLREDRQPGLSASQGDQSGEDQARE